ncbi:MAG: methylenetetrahydrofolate reductase [NAD(P)H] [Luteibaculum sp.]
MKVIDHLEQAKGKTLFSFEVLPPLKGDRIDNIFSAIDPLLEFDPKFINVTYHREEFVYKEKANNLLEKFAIRKRPGTIGISVAIQTKYKIDVVPHLICGGFSKDETEDALIELKFLGIDNILALRGDPIKTERTFVPSPGGHRYASELIEQIVAMNHGKFLHDEVYENAPTDFCIGCAGYPEKHLESISPGVDLKNLKRKVDAGADYIVTQLFYDNKKYFEFVDRCREMGITVPIIPGLKPLGRRRHLSFIPKTFSVDFPDELANQLETAKTDADIADIGTKWCIQQSKELMKAGVPCLHFYTMGNSAQVAKIAREVF